DRDSVFENEALLEEVGRGTVVEPVVEVGRPTACHRELTEIAGTADVFHGVDQPAADPRVAGRLVDDQFLDLCDVVARVHQSGDRHQRIPEHAVVLVYGDLQDVVFRLVHRVGERVVERGTINVVPVPDLFYQREDRVAVIQRRGPDADVSG